MKRRSPRVPVPPPTVIPTVPDPDWKGAAPDKWIKLVKQLESFIALYEERWIGPYELLATARKLYLHSYFVADFGPVSVLVGYQAVEAAFRLLYADRERDSFDSLIKQAAADGFLKGDQIAWANDLRAMRNLLAHPAGSVYTHHPYDNMLIYAHEIVVKILKAWKPDALGPPASRARPA